MDSITINQWSFCAALAIMWCLFCLIIIASGHVDVKRFKRWGLSNTFDKTTKKWG